MTRRPHPKTRNKRDLDRRRDERPSHDRILIVSEGSKTEPNYFREICISQRLHTASVVLQHSQVGTNCLKVVNYAESLFLNGDPYKNIQARAFDRVYAVIDRDDHPCYFNALKAAEAKNNKLRNDNKQRVSFEAIASIPCFELWLLLHYENIWALLHRDEVVSRLEKYIPHYYKGAGNMYATTRSHLETATQRAQALATKSNPFNDSEPFTAIHTLVTLLTELKSQNR